MSALLQYFPSFLGLCPSSHAPLCRRCRRRPNGTEGTRSQLFCLGPGLLIQHGRGGVPGRLQSWPLVPTWEYWLAHKYWAAPGVVVCWKFWNSTLGNFCSRILTFSSISRLLYLWQAALKEKVRSMVLTASEHNLVACRSSVCMPRVGYLSLHPTITFCWWDITHISWFDVWSSWWPPLRGDLRIFHCLLCRRRL